MPRLSSSGVPALTSRDVMAGLEEGDSDRVQQAARAIQLQLENQSLHSQVVVLTQTLVRARFAPVALTSLVCCTDLLAATRYTW